jgi:hypothetical protein
LSDNAFYFHFFLANAMGLIPMNLGLAYLPITKANRANSLQLSPSSRAVNLLQALESPISAFNSDSFNIANISNYLENRWHRQG